MRAAAAGEKNALVLFALFRARRERRWTPREVSIVGDADDEEESSDDDAHSNYSATRAEQLSPWQRVDA